MNAPLWQGQAVGQAVALTWSGVYKGNAIFLAGVVMFDDGGGAGQRSTKGTGVNIYHCYLEGAQKPHQGQGTTRRKTGGENWVGAERVVAGPV